MGTKRPQGSKPLPDASQPLALGALIAEICETPKPTAPAPVSRLGRARRAGPFKVPASMAGPGNPQRDELARRFKQHLRGVSGSNKLGADPDETVPVVKPRLRARPGFGVRPPPSSMFRRGPVSGDDDGDE
jgi:hypothetical protein